MYKFSFFPSNPSHAPFFSANCHRSALFETKLADLILRNTSKETLIKVSTAMVRLLEAKANIIRRYFNTAALEILRDKLEQLNLQVNLDVNAIFYCIVYNLTTSNDLYLQVSLQKIFVEQIYFISLINPADYQSETLTQRALRSLAKAARATMNFRPNYANSVELVGRKTDLIDYFRPDSLFETANRGRIELPDGSPLTFDSASDQCFGILPEKVLPNEFKGRLPFPVFHAAAEYVPNVQASFFKTCVSLDIPYCSGPSGTISYLLSSLPFLLNLSRNELEEFILIHAASLVGMGHHSFYESIIVAQQMGLFAKISYANDNGISVNYQHDENDPVYGFIPPAIRDLNEFQDLMNEFQDFRPRL